MHVTDAPWVLVGCGYTATRLARTLLREGAHVIATRRSRAAADRVATALGSAADLRVADLLEPATLADLIPPRAIVVVSAQPSPDGTTAGEEALVAAASARASDPARRLIYLSSTGVYGPGAGAWVDEDAPLAPVGPLGRRRLAAETALLAAASRAGLSAVSLRAAGIYGPGRGVHARLLAGTYRVIGDGEGFVSRIHVDDLAAAVRAAATAGGPLPRAAYNAADLEPTRAREHADRVAAALGLPPPPSVPPDQVSPMARELTSGDRRIDSRRLREELGLALSYPTWREGLAQALAEERGQAPLTDPA